ncbi:hypothetical protein ACRRTK_021673 [Alexandromys fortis]
MRKAGLWGLLWTFLVSEARAATDPAEERYNRVEGQTLAVSCPFNIRKYASSRKAWQRLPDGKEPLTLVVTERPSANPTEVHMGKYTLKDDPGEAMLHVQMTDLRVADSGLYRCVIYHPPNDPVLLFHPVRLVVTKEQAIVISEESSGQSSKMAKVFKARFCTPQAASAVSATVISQRFFRSIHFWHHNYYTPNYISHPDYHKIPTQRQDYETIHSCYLFS